MYMRVYVRFSEFSRVISVISQNLPSDIEGIQAFRRNRAGCAFQWRVLRIHRGTYGVIGISGNNARGVVDLVR